MKTRPLISLAAAGLLLSACVPSINPFYFETDLVSDQRLPGEWLPADPKDDGESWKFEPAEEKSFTLTVTEKEGKKGVFIAHLFKLKQEYFLDLTPKECSFAVDQAGLVGASMIRGHLVARVAQLEPSLKLAFCDMDWLDKYLKTNPKALAHRRGEDDLVLTAGTAELQQFLLKHLEAELFGELRELVRKPETGGVKKP